MAFCSIYEHWTARNGVGQQEFALYSTAQNDEESTGNDGVIKSMVEVVRGSK